MRCGGSGCPPPGRTTGRRWTQRPPAPAAANRRLVLSSLQTPPTHVWAEPDGVRGPRLRRPRWPGSSPCLRLPPLSVLPGTAACADKAGAVPSGGISTRRHCGPGHPLTASSTPLGVTDTSYLPRPLSEPRVSPSELLGYGLLNLLGGTGNSSGPVPPGSPHRPGLSLQRVSRIQPPVTSTVTLLIQRAVAFPLQAEGPLTALCTVPVPCSTQGSYVRPCAHHRWRASVCVQLPPATECQAPATLPCLLPLARGLCHHPAALSPAATWLPGVSPSLRPAPPALHKV